MPSNSPAAGEPPQTLENDASNDVSEDGADQDSPEEGTPASPHNKRRVGRPGRKRKQLLPEMATSDPCANAPPTPPEEPEPSPSPRKRRGRRRLEQTEKNREEPDDRNCDSPREVRRNRRVTVMNTNTELAAVLSSPVCAGGDREAAEKAGPQSDLPGGRSILH